MMVNIIFLPLSIKFYYFTAYTYYFFWMYNMRNILLAFSSEVQSHVMEGHVEMEHVICHGSTEVQDVMCHQQSGDPEHMMEIEALLADWLREESAEAQGSAEAQAQGSAEAQVQGSAV